MIGAILVTVMGLLTGMRISFKLKLRVRMLNSFYQFLNEMETKIRYQAVAVDDLISQAIDSGNYNNLSFLISVNKMIKSSIPFETAWYKSIDEEDSFISPQDIDLIKMTARFLGKSDIEGQVSSLVLQKNLVKNSIDSAEKELLLKGKMYRSVCTLAGAGIGIILI